MNHDNWLIQDWQLQYLFERLANILETSKRGPDTFQRMFGHRQLSKLILQDGVALNHEDEAIQHLISYAYAASSRAILTLDDLHSALLMMFLGGGDGKPVVPLGDLHRLYAMKDKGGWTELDRLISSLTRYHTSFSEIIDPMIASFRTDPRDDGLVDGDFYALGCLVQGQPLEKVAFGTKAEFVLRFIDDVIQFAGDSHARDSLIRSQLILTRNGEPLFAVPLITKTFSTEELEQPQTGFAVRCGYRFLTAYWPDLQWLVRDPEVMKALAAAVPAKSRSMLKGRYLAEDLGL